MKYFRSNASVCPSWAVGWASLALALGLSACSDADPAAGADAGGASGESTGGAGPHEEADVGGGAGFTAVGVCGERGEATVSATSFDGFEEYYLVSDEGFGDELCVVRFDVTRVATAPDGCERCVFSHLVELSRPQILRDEGGVCADSELALGAPAIAALDGSQVAYGFVSEFAGHASVLMKYDDTSAGWQPYGNATYDPESEAFRFDRRSGFCNY